MTMREWSAVISAVLVAVGTVWYIYAALKKGSKVKPVLATWIVLGSTTTLSFVTYWTSPKHSLVSNACNAASALSTLSILVLAIWLSRKKGGSVSFSKFQKWCLAISGLIALSWMVIVWGFGGSGFVPNVLTQVLMIVGYLVTAQKLWSAPKNTEAFFTWYCLLVASVIALYTAIVSSDELAKLYSIRAIVASATIVVLMHRIERRSQAEGQVVPVS